MPLAVCCMINFASFASPLASLPSEVVHFFLKWYQRRTGHTYRRLRLALGHLYFVLHFTVDYFHFVTDTMRDPQNLRKRHTSLLLRQSVKSLKSILQISHSGNFLRNFSTLCLVKAHIQPIGNSLADPRLISFVAIPNMLSTSTIICVIMSVIAVVGATFV
jgi:hypothetical protein